MTDFIEIQSKWQKKWAEAKLFEPEIDEEKPKFFVTFPYPYINGYPHIGHSYTMMRVEAFARYKRMKGYNVLFPQGWHCTGSPIVSAAERVKEGEEKQIKILKDQGFSDEEIPKFADPKHWVEVFAPAWKEDVTALGVSIDWRRNFITTSLNPHYDKFIRWQFLKLKDKNYVVKGKFPVVWCPKDNEAVSDHSRSKGEGETAQEFVLLKFKYDDGYIIAATLRPETVFGQTNLWVGPENEYVQATVDGEKWVVSEECAKKLEQQDKKVEVVKKIKGKELIGKYVKAPFIHKEIIILPSHFCDTSKGTGIVTSVPSDAPDDYIGLRDLKEHPEELEKYGVLPEIVKRIEPVPIIDSKELGDMAAVKVVEDMKIKNQHEREKLEEAKKLVYKKGFYEGVMNENCDGVAGMKVMDAKEKVKKMLLEKNEADLFYELTGKVVCRCLTDCIVKIVDDQWFIDYGNEEWKDETRKCLEQVKLYPEKVRPQFEHTIDWLHQWACTREKGLGTRLPWDERWLIESLSDSTIYPAYYTIAHLIKDVDPEKLTPEFFDYVFYGKGEKPEVESVDKMREEFLYWFPCDFRNSGKDLVQNHLTFYLFNHVAMFDKDHWPNGIGANGWVTVDGQKMSKSLGNMIPLRVMAKDYGADASRITILNGGEGLDDPNWDSQFARTIYQKLEQLHKLIKDNYFTGCDQRRKIDDWFESKVNIIIKETTDAMDDTLFRTAIQKSYFELIRVIKWYLKRTSGEHNKKLLQWALESIVKMLAPFTPHICEEMWKTMKKEGFVSVAEWPNYDEKKIDERAEFLEEFVGSVLVDMAKIKDLAKIENPKKITLFVSAQWKYFFIEQLKKEMKLTRNVGDLIKMFVKTEHGKEIAKMIPMFIKNPSRLPRMVLNQMEDFEALKENKKFFESELGLKVEVVLEENADNPKASQALPSKPAILLE
ncbi:leucine--tRNA ligase [Candidatus Woesearchaeota archaeon]|nr:MAG: leucine--tRNA ligase [Candidatus Woesearchaeota archaeon]